MNTGNMRSIGKNKNKIISLVVSLAVLGLLFASGPAQAFILGLDSDVNSVEQPGMIIFTASIDIEANERLPIDSISLKLDGPENVVCVFGVNGNELSGCNGIEIEKISNSNYSYGYGYGYYGYGYNFGYGYGYGDGILKYKITLDSQDFEPGTYDTSLVVDIDGKTFSQAGEDITITEKQNSNSNYGSSGTTKVYAKQDDKKNDKKNDVINNADAVELGNKEADDSDTQTDLSQTGIRKAIGRITGAVTGALGGQTIFYVIVFILSVAILSLVVYFVRKFR